MASAVEICNKALYLIGQESIAAIDPPDDNDRARLCAAFYASSRDATLRAYEWNFAIRRDTLVLDGTAPENGYAAQYVLPTDPYCLRVLELNDDPEAEWVIEGRRLLTNESEAIIKFIARITETGYFDSLFEDTLAARLAMDLAMPVTKKYELMESMAKLYEYKLNEARGISMEERGKIPEPTSPFISVR